MIQRLTENSRHDVEVTTNLLWKNDDDDDDDDGLSSLKKMDWLESLQWLMGQSNPEEREWQVKLSLEVDHDDDVGENDDGVYSYHQLNLFPRSPMVVVKSKWEIVR